jgi:AraC family transcriptional regulator
MPLASHGDRKYLTSEKLGEIDGWSALRVEHRKFEPGPQQTFVPSCTELVLLLGGGGAVTRVGDGQLQQTVARPGMTYLVPTGTEERSLQLSDRMECLHIYLPSDLIEQSALQDHDIDPAKVQLAYVGGLADATIFQICSPLRDLLNRPREAFDGLFVDGIQVALSAHLLGRYSLDRWRAPEVEPTLDARRLQRVIDYIEASLAQNIRLTDLAAQACLSPFHFARLFRQATGLSPNRYVTQRRVETAQQHLAGDASSLVEIGLDCGFGSQANFTRVFRKVSGLTPGQYRDLCRS